ncbi:hypothetical protein [Erythrobacter rubeus]|uniref:DUF4261 domain-containing protein n=1 Tax=Erythrobacter rubeus TaxID=2760803 RepID=A0ABR8KMY3_9SPHN|nr:hypothetical protein [Erythrobacter rubeus]MBD2841973.1 hypothetical protein [Erythrobacter rubeus]
MFATGKRPTRAAIREFADGHRSLAISHDPSGDRSLHLVPADGSDHAQAPVGQDAIEEAVWLELIKDGLTFEIEGLAPGTASQVPDVKHRFDVEDLSNPRRLEGVYLLPSQHIGNSEGIMPVLRSLVEIARDAVHSFEHLEAVLWEPAQSLIGRRFFESTATAWIDGGAFPALGLTAFRETGDGALESVGLKHWTGQELRIEPPISDDKVAATRLGVRLINHLVITGGLTQSERITAPDNTRLVLKPSQNAKFVRVWRE